MRHAEKAAAPAGDPPLTEAGAARARALAALLAPTGVDAIVTTQLARTRATAQPLADSLKLVPEVVAVAGGQPVEPHARAVADAVRRHAGRTVLVVGHSNTVPAIIAALGGPRLPEICDAAFSNLFVLVLDPPTTGGTPGRARLVRAHYGAPDAEGAEHCPGMQPR